MSLQPRHIRRAIPGTLSAAAVAGATGENLCTEPPVDFSMPIGKRKSRGAIVITRRPIDNLRKRARGLHFNCKLPVVNTQRVFIQK